MGQQQNLTFQGLPFHQNHESATKFYLESATFYKRNNGTTYAALPTGWRRCVVTERKKGKTTHRTVQLVHRVRGIKKRTRVAEARRIRNAREAGLTTIV